tara:strand:- start:165 stop:2672 length:2508 start_codon:yes stop_codon:yes gene_type:complete
MGFNIGSKIVKATGGSISRVGNHKIHQFPGEYVTDGLCLYVDTTHHDSLDIGSESGHDAGTIYDLSGNGRHGTITNMPYNNITGTTSLKHNDFGGAGSYIEFSHAETPYANLLTTELLVRISNHPGGSSYDTLWQKGTNWNSTNNDAGLHLIYGALRYHFGDHWQGNGTTYTETNLSLNKWYHIVTSSENLQGRNSRLYVNGVLVNANPCDGSAGRGPYTGPSSASSLRLNRGNGGGHNGEFGLFRTYNRQLSDEEVLQNFNSIKTRIHGNYSNYNVSTFTPTCSGNKGKVEVLAVGGGGSGGNDVGGGGAGGRALYNSSFAVNSGVAIDVTVGVGATSADTAVNGHGGNGGTTQFSTLTALGGNGGYGRSGGKSYAGWNGGGGSYNSSGGVPPTGAGGEAGYKGGDTGNPNADNCGCGGGAGAGSVGGNGIGGSGGKGGAGGDGVAYSISGTSKYYAGGGGGSFYNVTNAGGLSGSGVGGRGAGGAQSSGDFSTPGAPRTGSGGGGGFSSGSVKTGGHGSEGCVIVRYPAEDYNIELLIVAGGGGGGSASGNGSAGGGGGAGGLLYYSKVPVSSGKNYKVWVGEGGDKVDGDNHGKNGKDSFFDDKIAIGGGGGAKGHNNGSTGIGQNDGRVGGSAGGGGSNAGSPSSGYCLGGKAISGGQGNDGGNGSDGSGSDGAGGGGGAGAVGGDGVGGTGTAQGGAGGAGLAYSITGTSTTYAGGGGGGGATNDSNSGGGDGGAGGGGRGGHNGAVGVDGTTNTGGGGGGSGCRSGTNLNSGDGGTGIVIVAYKGPQRGTGGTVSTTARPGYTTHIFYGYPKDGSSGNAMKNSAHLFVA